MTSYKKKIPRFEGWLLLVWSIHFFTSNMVNLAENWEMATWRESLVSISFMLTCCFIWTPMLGWMVRMWWAMFPVPFFRYWALQYLHLAIFLPSSVSIWSKCSHNGDLWPRLFLFATMASESQSTTTGAAFIFPPISRSQQCACGESSTPFRFTRNYGDGWLFSHWRPLLSSSA